MSTVCAANGTAHALWHACPAACGRRFSSGRAALIHMGMSPACLEVHKQPGAELRASKARKVRVRDPSCARFLSERTHVVADSLAGLSLDDNMGAAQLGRVTVQMKSIMSVCAAELARRLEPKSRSMEGVTAKYIVDEVLDVFSGLETQDQLFNHLAKKYPYIEPVEHVFGYDQVHTTDAEGFTYSKKDVKCSGWYMPMGRVVERLLQEDPRALEMVMRTQAEWAAEAPPHGTSKRVYIDVTHGDLFKEHPELGDAQRGKAQHGLRLCFILYYDGLEVTDSR